MSHRAWPIFCLFNREGFHYVGQAGLELLTSSDPPTSASQSAGIRGVIPFTFNEFSKLVGFTLPFYYFFLFVLFFICSLALLSPFVLC